MRTSFLVLLFACLCLAVSAEIHFQETFDNSWSDRWVVSDWKKSDGTQGQWKHAAGEWYGDKEKDMGIQTSQDARFYAISAKIPKPFSNEGKDLVLQYQVRFPQKIDCGGGYIKLLPSTLDQKNFGGDSPYYIMFGPDICGTSTKKTHVIFNYKDKNLLTKKNIVCETDQLSHVYTLIVRPDNTYEVRIDGEKKESGSLYDDWDFLPPKTIKDPSVSKPKDWIDDPMMDDPSDVKPSDWDKTPKQIPDPEAEKPSDWDDEADGEWEAPMIDNPEWKGEWKPKRISNPDYKGKWVHPEIDNPEYVEDKNLYRYSDIGAVGFELWQVKAGTIFDNIIVADSWEEAKSFMDETFNKSGEKEMFDEAEKARTAKEEADRKKAEEERKKAEAAKEEDDDDDDDDDEEKGHDEL
jgi:calreticulin